MNSFFNYHSRSVDLPEGCKDLIDVLNLASVSTAPATQTRRLGLGVAGSIADIGTYISRFSASTAKATSLWVHIPCESPGVVAVFCGKHGLRSLILVNARREQAVRAVLADFAIAPFQDDLLANNVRGLQCQLSAVSDLGQFLRELLAKGFSVTENIALEFDHREKNGGS